MKKEKHTVGDWLIRLLKGIVIGFGAILPGLSGGVLAVIFGVYDRMIAFLGNIRKTFLKQVSFFSDPARRRHRRTGLFLPSAAFDSYKAQFVFVIDL